MTIGFGRISPRTPGDLLLHIFRRGLPCMISRVATAALCGCLAVLLAPSVGLAQASGQHPRVGILNAGAVQDDRVGYVKDELRKLGYVEGRNVVFVHREAEGHLDRLPQLAAELVATNVNVLVAIGPSVFAAKQATNRIPIVIAFSGDPVGVGVVSNLARPEANITGISLMSSDLAGKRVQLLKETVPHLTRLAALYTPNERSTGPELRETEAAARQLGVTLQPLPVEQPQELAPAFAAAAQARAEALIVFVHWFALNNQTRIIELAAHHRLPAMFGYRELVEAGGLLSYGPNGQVMSRLAAGYVDRILKGATPADLPIQRPTTFELVINLKTAKALGLTIPNSLLDRADEVIH